VSASGGREAIVGYLRGHVIGPSAGDTEELRDAPGYLYFSAVLYPRGAANEDILEEEGGDDTDSGSAGNELVDGAVRLANERLPASAALSFVLRGTARVRVTVAAAIYEKGDGVFKRNALAPETASVVPDNVTANVLGGRATVTSRWRAVEGGHLVTVALLNADEATVGNQHDPTGCLFQVSMSCEPDGGAIVEYPAVESLHMSDEEAELRLQYRHVRTYAIGHGCAADWEEVGTSAARVWTEFMPFVAVKPLVVSSGDDQVLRLVHLARVDEDTLTSDLSSFVDGYEAWVDGLPARPDGDGPLARAHDRILGRLRTAVIRLRRGVLTLRSDEVRTAFQLAHEAMLRQMRHGKSDLGGRSRDLTHAPAMPDAGEYDSPDRMWFPFQLAFLLLCISSVLDDADDDRSTVDLIWAATGAGKTEAYLALASMAIIHRRMTRSPEVSGGTTVITRYTLRLLTQQQFERAARMVCALESLRGVRREIGRDPVSIGLWIGDDTPSSYSDAQDRAREILDADAAETGFQFERCPWCGVRIVPRRRTTQDAYGFSATANSFTLNCPSPACDFHQGLPVQVVDQALYADPPTVLIGTVDKFTQVAWLEKPGAFFGGSGRRPPDLVIQDELHLLGGPLGTIVGLYESAFSALCELRGAKPKVIAATATIREAPAQVTAIFGSSTALFPPSGLDARDSYFAQVDEDATGRGFLGVLAPSHTPSTSLVRTCAVLAQAPIEISLSPEELDSYWTIVAYHNSLRELGKTVTFARDDIPAWVEVIARDPAHIREIGDSNVLELTGNVQSARIPESLSRLSTPYNERDAVAFAACTNMLSVGVDIPRLGLMVVNGQPKQTSEYIQASSRVGRAAVPGLVIAHYSASKPRDRSHYEQFVPYHNSLYRWVEPTSVTPFSLPARRRALHAALVIVVRHGADLARNEQAHEIDPDDVAVQRAVDVLLERARVADPDEARATERDVRELIDVWCEQRDAAESQHRTLHYKSKKPHPALLTTFGSSWGVWETLNSMRNVDGEAVLGVSREYDE
jgi:hypothetical protein